MVCFLGDELDLLLLAALQGRPLDGEQERLASRPRVSHI